jgi:hypothetical protein
LRVDPDLQTTASQRFTTEAIDDNCASLKKRGAQFGRTPAARNLPEANWA